MILVTGGAGYIGSHTNKILSSYGYETVVYDNLVYGHKQMVKWGEFVEGDLSDVEQLRCIFNKFRIDAVLHFAAYAYVGESVQQPEKYYINNVVNTINLLRVMNEFGVKCIIFSSTCATYGEPLEVPITENHPQNPINPYGRTKLMIESIIKDYADAYGLKYVVLRYFNAAGADPELEIGELHVPETHLIPRILDAAIGRRESITVYGNDYQTRDGACVRDYIHVTDLANAHFLALQYLLDGGVSEAFNLGNGSGYSVREVIHMVEQVTRTKIKVIESARRPGDPAVLIGSARKAGDVLGWKSRYSDLDSIISTAWGWHQKLYR